MKKYSVVIQSPQNGEILEELFRGSLIECFLFCEGSTHRNDLSIVKALKFINTIGV